MRIIIQASNRIYVEHLERIKRKLLLRILLEFILTTYLGTTDKLEYILSQILK
jgi:hypothetical protein